MENDQVSGSTSQKLQELGLNDKTFSPIVITESDFDRFPTVDHIIKFIEENDILIEPMIIDIMKIHKIKDISQETKQLVLREKSEKKSYLFETTKVLDKHDIQGHYEPNYLTSLALKAIKIHERIISIRDDHNSEYVEEIKNCKRQKKIFIGLSTWRARHTVGKYRGELVVFNPFKRENIIKDLRYGDLNKYMIFRLPPDYYIIPEHTLVFGEY